MTTSVGWHETPIGDIAHVISGYAFKSESFINEGIPVIQIKNKRFG